MHSSRNFVGSHQIVVAAQPDAVGSKRPKATAERFKKL
jgi:hypothetical protein